MTRTAISNPATPPRYACRRSGQGVLPRRSDVDHCACAGVASECADMLLVLEEHAIDCVVPGHFVKVALGMQLNAFTDYSLRVLVYAAARPDRRCLTGDVATAFGISRHHVVKVVNELQHLGYLET